MNRFATILSASALSAIAFGAESYAAMPSPMADTSSKQIETTVQSLPAGMFNIVRIDSLRKHDSAHERFAMTSPSAPEARQLQASIIANKGLSGQLKAQNIELTNIVGAEKAADGAVTFYLR